jgi:hypothetical protein
MVRCGATKANGERCTLAANGPQGVCWAHDPANAAKRSKMASKAARSKPSGEIADIKGRLTTLAEDVLAGRADRADAAVAGQLLNTVIRAVGMELKVKEVVELEERLQALEASDSGRRVG